ncbi:MAG: hypothetical protein NVS3B10_29930 [Polyangiales bacterium]
MPAVVTHGTSASSIVGMLPSGSADAASVVVEPSLASSGTSLSFEASTPPEVLPLLLPAGAGLSLLLHAYVPEPANARSKPDATTGLE